MRDHGDDDAEFANKVFQKAHDDSGWSPLKGRDEHPNDCFGMAVPVKMGQILTDASFLEPRFVPVSGIADHTAKTCLDPDVSRSGQACSHAAPG
jgi:hypothetical protein